MALNIVELPYSYFPDFSRGRALWNAQIFVGNVDTDPEIPANQKQVTVRQEDGTEVQIAQPVRTSSGGVPTYNGSPVTVLVDGPYSIKVLDRSGADEYYSPDVTKGVPLTPETLPTYTDLVFDSVADMVVGTPKITWSASTIGTQTSSGGTKWRQVSFSSPMTIQNFEPLTELRARDFGASTATDLSTVITEMMSVGYPNILIDVESGDFATPLPDSSAFNIRGLGKTKSLFTKSFDGLLFPLFGSGAELRDMQITGGNSSMVLCPSGTAQQKMSRVRLIPTGGNKALVFEDEGGELIQCTACTFGSGDTQVGGVGMVSGVVDSGGAQRHFTDCEGAGNPTVDLSGMNDTFIVNGFSTNGLLFSDDTSKAIISNMRWGVSVSNPINRTQVRGENIVIENIVGLRADLFCSASRFSTVAPDYDVTDQGSGNMVSIRGRLYTPTFTGSGGVQPDLGSGSISGFYSREGNKVTIQVEVVWAADSVIGDGRFRIGLPSEMPVVQSIGLQQFGGNGQVRATPSFMVGGRFFANERYLELGGVDTSGARVDIGVGTVLAAGDRIWYQGEYYT